jgi:hypothetical protein
MHGWAPEVIGAIGTPITSPGYTWRCSSPGQRPARERGREALRRMYARTENRDQGTTWATGEAQYDAVCAWGIPDHGLLQRLSALYVPVFEADGDSDPMILPRYSYLLAGLIPHAQVKIYADSASGGLPSPSDRRCRACSRRRRPCSASEGTRGARRGATGRFHQIGTARPPRRQDVCSRPLCGGIRLAAA